MRGLLDEIADSQQLYGLANLDPAVAIKVKAR